jgi:general secretion pathway protein M
MANPERTMSGVATLKQSVAGFWNERDARERSLLGAAIAVVVLGLSFVLLIDPAMSGRDDLAQRLPILRQQAAEVRVLTREAGAAGRVVAPVSPMTRESLETSLAQRDLTAQSLTQNGELARAQFEAASFAALVEWLSDLQRNARVAVLEAKVEAGAQVDMVNATFTLRQQRPESAQ